jgi:predicted transcriptional regulator with HTH domain
MLRIIYATYPKKAFISDLCKKLGLTEKQIKGVLGSFGRRLNQIPGYGNGMTFIMRDNAGYRLAEAARTALDDLKLV